MSSDQICIPKYSLISKQRREKGSMDEAYTHKSASLLTTVYTNIHKCFLHYQAQQSRSICVSNQIFSAHAEDLINFI